MAHVTSKRLLLAGVFALSSAFVLASCDAVTAVPVNYENPIILKDGNVYEDDDNKLGEIYDALASNKNEKVVAALLEKIAEKEFGTYAELKACFPTVDEHGDPVMDKAKALAHIEKYAHQFKKDDDATLKEGVSAEDIQLARLEYFFADLNDRINKVVFDEISSDTYRDTINKTEFLEEKYARAKRQDNYDILGFDEDGKATINFKSVFVDSSFQEENVRNYLTNFEATYEDYITKKIIPDVYKDKLVEEYIIDSNYSALGRAYGRKINFVKVSYESEDPNTAYRLANLYAEKALDVEGAKGADVDYTSLVNWVKGFEGVETKTVGDVTYPVIKALDLSDATLKASLDEIYGEQVEFKGVCKKTGQEYDATVGLTNYGFTPGFKYYEKTKLGEILQRYQKAVVGEATRFASSEDVAEYDTFTSKGKQSKEQGLMQEITKLAIESYADDGWYVKNDASGSLSLPEEFKNRLFNIKVSNDFDKDDWKYVKDESYFKEVQGHYYLTPASASDAKYNFILRDTSGNALYIIEILEAPSTSKLNKSSSRSYLITDPTNPFKTEEVARQIAKILGTKDTYTTNAYTSYLKLYTFVYHDTSVYDYLKETYPDLFED